MGKWRSGFVFGNPTRLLRSASHFHRFSRFPSHSPSPSNISPIFFFYFKSSFSSKKTTMAERTPHSHSSTRRGQSHRGNRSVEGQKIWVKVDHGNKSPQTVNTPQQRQSSPGRKEGDGESLRALRPFDICRSGGVDTVRLKASLLELNREKRKELVRSACMSQCHNLRSGMILLKNHLSHEDQVKIIRTCQKLGIGIGGFYQPSYSDGAKLHLQMMCLGKNWDPEAKYVDIRPVDGAKPPEIPEVFQKLVKGAIQASHDFLLHQNKHINVEDELPNMSPDLCIINFYNENGRLGLHQDRDESPQSIAKGLPVVSFSVGNSAEFLYGVERDVDKAEKVVLESGDVLIFGGKSRMIFHGVSTIQANTTPKLLIEETNLRPGRLNLTFRQY
ncbi:uncharacterized protein LOC120264530 isoform X1 [Dioscorea cayenensis subsp. rotundata]|uniref:DNA N(6)-methyladenine demethylase n=1 Tax=Dioscorea cayennensis subsp. rotundata TaxID=55577 RepID=A0AB40BNV3_DIOCR|nr:uncharacterized protein LOC120264530 isoform X1 [Dioscorea cayenensis subsp. rotundata]XP_039128281.1 uncharacterized protein LOC120264530 isoform X1 [Dioscorea cayenensis subsp. rotundata]XP_039128282.1 uncharacterized protein LOC120264530 isoform X1 [Dioscorea cayenensis subsp. rotundata]